ncbi:tetratricopeptide repeat protein [Microbispora siamensis]
MPTYMQQPQPTDPGDVHTAAEMAAALRALAGDRSYGQLDRAVQGHGRLPKSTLGEALSKGRPNEATLELILRACAVPRDLWPAWKAARERALTEVPPGLVGLMRVEQADPRRLGVHAPIDAPGAVGDLPVYVPRDADPGPRGVRALISRSVERGGFIVLVGDSSVGKTRCAYEAIRELVPQWWLFHPANAEEVRRAAEATPNRLVVWLDELQKFLGGTAGLTADTVRALLSSSSIVIATIWPKRYDAYVALAQDGDPYETEREVLGLADVVHLGSRFSPSELNRAKDIAQAGDRRIALALKSTDYGLTQVIAAAPQLIDRWRNANPYAAAILNAAIDATRLGAQSPLSADLLRDAAPGYCDARQRADAPENWFETALAYATAKLKGAASALAPVAAPTAMGKPTGYLVADYLQQYAGQQRYTAIAPTTTWQALCDHLSDPSDKIHVGQAARNRLLYGYAEYLYQSAYNAGHEDAAIYLPYLMIDQGRTEEALDILHAQADAGDAFAAVDIAELLAKQGQANRAVEILRSHAETEDRDGAIDVALFLAKLGEVDEALDILRIHADEDRGAAEELAKLLAKQGRAEELRARADAGDPVSAIQAAKLLAKLGEVDEALDILRIHADEDRGAAEELAKLLAKQGRAEELRARADAGDPVSAIQVAKLLVLQP